MNCQNWILKQFTAITILSAFKSDILFVNMRLKKKK